MGGVTIRSGELVSLFERCGLAPCDTILQSGNVVFELGDASPDACEETLEVASQQTFGRSLLWFVRTAEQWKQIVEANPFPDFVKQDPSHLLIHVAKEPFDAVPIADLTSTWDGTEQIAPNGNELYATFPEGIGTSKLFKDRRWLKLTSHATGRNWNTALRIMQRLATG